MRIKISSILDLNIFKSRITNEHVTNKERILGYLFGPMGVLLLNGILATYLNVFYTDVIKLTSVGGGLFLTVFPIASRFVDALINIYIGHLIESTKTSQGKARPWLLVAAPSVLISGILICIVPSANIRIQVIWVVFSFNLFYGIAFNLYNMSHNLMVPLSTRNIEERGSLSVYNNIATTMMTGIVSALVFPTVIMPILGVDQKLWLLTISMLSILSFPLVMLEYYYTNERITLENVDIKETTIGVNKQFKAIVTDKYCVVIFLYFIISQIASQLKNISLIYYCNYVLGTYNDGYTQALVSVLGGIPMGIGIFAVWPLAKRFGKRNTTLVGFLIFSLGSIVCFLSPKSLPTVLAGQFIKNVGGLPCAYVFMALLADVLDHMEWKTGFRCDGCAMSIYAIITTVSAGVSTGIFNFGITKAGYIAPVYDVITNTTVATVQNATTQSVITFFFVGLEAITGILCAILLCKLDVEKVIKQEQLEILQKKEKII